MPGGGVERVRVCLVDVSASVTRGRPDWRASALGRISAQAREAEQLGHDLLVVSFASEVARVFGPGDPAELDLVPEDLRVSNDAETDLAAALGGVEAMLRRPRGAADLRWIGDRAWTGHDPGGAVERWRADGATFESLELPPASRTDVALVELRVPREIESGAPLGASCVLALSDAAGAEGIDVSLELVLEDGRGGSRRIEKRAHVPASAARAPWSVPCDLGAASEGWTRVRARVSAEGDPVPENDTAAASTRSRGARIVGWIAGGDASSAAALLQGVQGLHLVDLRPEDLPAALPELDALVTIDVDPRSLPGELLLDFVRGGHGWLAAGGHALIEAKSASERDPAASTLPLEVDDEDETPRDVVLVVDASGSMAGGAMDAVRAAALELVASARASDTVELRFFTRALEPAIRLGSGGGDASQRAGAAEALLRARLPGGATDVPAALEELARSREATDRRALVLFLSDGRDQARDGGLERGRSSLARLGAANARVAVIAVGAQADLAYLEALASGEPTASLVRAESGDLERIFDEELAQGRILEGALEARAIAKGELEGLTTLAEALAAAGPMRMERAARMRAREGDAVALETVEGRPLLAWRREGLGVAGTLATLPRGDWAQDASSWNGWSAILRFAARSSTGRFPYASFADGSIRVEAAPQGWPTSLAGALRAPNGESYRLGLEIEAREPGLSPEATRSGPAPPGWAATAGAHELVLTGPDGTRIATLPLIVACPDEFRWPPRRLAAAAGPGNTAVPPGALRARHPALGRALTMASIAFLALGAVLGARGGGTGSGARSPARVAGQAEGTSCR